MVLVVRFELLMAVKISQKHAISIFSFEYGGGMFLQNAGYLPVSPHSVTTQKNNFNMELVNENASFCFLVFIKVCSAKRLKGCFHH
jgi:hypothetical protein